MPKATNDSRAGTTDGERIRILDTSPTTSTARGSATTETSTSARRASESKKVSTPPNEPEDYFAYRNANFSSAETSISTSVTSLDNSFIPPFNGRKGSDDISISCDSQSRYSREINIRRTALDYFQAEKKYGLLPEESVSQKLKRALRSRCSCTASCFVSFFTSVLPIVTWLPAYRLVYILPDLISGFTVAILHIPQGMAYGILASLQAENGLYVSFFPVLVYFIFGTSRHISIGTFAVVSLMVSSAVATDNTILFRNSTQNNLTSATTSELEYFPATYLEMATSLCIAVGFWQLIMGMFRLGSLSVVLSDQLVSGFTTGAACHVATSQLPDLFGFSIGRYNGPLNLIYMYNDIFHQMLYANVTTIIVSAFSILILACGKEQINERFKDKLIMPVPVDLAVVILATAISYLLDFDGRYDVAVMGHIPTGLPQPSVPRFDLIVTLLTESFAIAIVAFVISLSMAKLFAKKHRYDIDPSQELIALGFANVVSSFFSCYPCSASLSRSLVQERSGGKTQVTSVVSCCILLLVLLVMAPLFYTLPRCILSAVILVALKGMFLQFRDMIKAWKVSQIDALIWLVTFLCTVFLDVTYGLLGGVIFSVFTVIVRTVVPSKVLLGHITGTELYFDVKRFKEARELRGIKIFRFQSALYFMNMEYFKSSLQKCVPIIPSEVGEETSIKNCREHIHHIIIDCSSFSYVDMSGLEALLEVLKEYAHVGITVYLAGCSVTMCDVMEQGDFFRKMPPSSSVFPTVHDAVQFCNEA